MNKSNKSSYVYRNSPVIILKAFNIIALIMTSTIFFIIKYVEKAASKNQSNSSIIKSIDYWIKQILANKYATIMLILLMLVTVVLLFRYFFYWKSSNIIVDKETVYSNKIGLFFKNRKQVNIKNIANVNLKGGIFYRFLGVYNVTIDINSSETANEFDYSIVLAKRKAHELSDIIAKSIQLNVKPENISFNKNDTFSCDTENFPKEYAFTSKEFVIHLIMNISLINVALFIFGIISSFGSSYILLIIAFAYTIKHIITEMNKSYNLHVKRFDEKITISYGFLSTNKFDIPIDKIIYAYTEQSFMAKIFGYKCIRIDTIGLSNNENETGLISLYLNNDKLKYISSIILPELYDDLILSSAVHKSSKSKEISNTSNEASKRLLSRAASALYYYLIYLSIVLIPIGILIYIPFKSPWILLAIAPIIIILSVFFYLNEKLCIDKHSITSVKGIFTSKKSVIPVDQIEALALEQNLLQKIFKLKSLVIYFRGGAFGKTLEVIRHFDEDTFNDIVEYYINGEKG
ncbi:PH domain-containing protein [Peptostreptococcus sp. D1]|uniref:PH domain-containing protein n=1 Tax=Peptostreptococcus sp. D1 TaxID=72304 RepID=UPI0008DF5B83|nr:PH domain-containing protein [Peptostreptococcus sp. D1]SFE54935.1 Uncharacterized membrane protein YdbT, contains bPH2 (pleckstrin homology) domain [Peptostreptococcus sp. D1]